MPEARGLLGLYYPWLIKSEVLHYGYALVMLAGLWTVPFGIHGRSAIGGGGRSHSGFSSSITSNTSC